MCHQTGGLIQRSLEEAGIPTVLLSGIREVAERLLPPRAAFVPYPLGRVCGHPFAPEEQRAIVRDALSLLASAQAPGSIVDLPYTW